MMVRATINSGVAKIFSLGVEVILLVLLKYDGKNEEINLNG